MILNAMKIGDPIPQFDGATGWINGSLAEAQEMVGGSPVLVHFWSISCGICKEKLPDLNELTVKYGPEGLRTIAVHLPRQESDTDVDSIRNAAEALDITEICAIDNRHELKREFKNEQGWVPVYYLFDSNGKLRSRSAGEFGVGILKNALERMF